MRRLALGLTVAIALQACAVDGLSFVTDDRVRIVQPTPNATIEPPYEFRWTAEDVDGYFVVFFDRSPVRPNETLLAMVPDTDPCRARADCPDTEWLADRNVYVVRHPSLRVDQLPDLRETDREKDRHDLTIVLFDESGRRVGESVFTTEFIVERESR
ncbi:MAG TPA: hypothetical protein VGA69_08000 [Nitriliruptorales bacterium]